MILHFSYIGLSFILLVFFLFLFGKLVLNFFVFKIDNSKSILLNVFLNIFLGLFSVIFIYSLYKADFITINLLFIPLILFLTYNSRPRFRIINLFSWEEIKGLLCFLSISLFVFSLQVSYYYNINTNSFNTIFIDNYYYSDVVKNLNLFGSENIFYTLNKFSPEYRTELIPYRYAELWFSSFIMDVFSLSSLESFYLITTPLIISLFIFFMFHLVCLRISNLYISIITSLVISFSSILFIPILNPSEKLIYLSETTIMGVFKQKTALSALFFLMGLYFFYSKQKLSFVIFLSIPLLYVAYLPAVWGGGAIYLIISYIGSIKKKGFFNEYLKYLLLLIFMILSYFIFFQFFGTFFRSIDSFSLKNAPFYKRIFSGFGPDLIINFKVFLKENLYNFIFYIFGATKNLILGFLFILPFVFFIYKELVYFKKLLLFVLCLLSVSFVMVLLRDGYGDNDQFFTNTLVFVNIFISFVFLKTIFFKNRNKTIIYLSMVVFFCLIPVLKIQYSSHLPASHQSFLSKVSKLCTLNKINTIFCVVSDSDTKTAYYKTSTKNILIPIVNYLNDISFSIANPEIFKNKNQKIDINLYGNVISNLRRKNKGFTNKELYKKYNIRAFLYYPKSKIPMYFNENRKTLIKDKSGYTFVFIQN
jgi:hypothetical protein